MRTHGVASVETEGMVIHWAGFYDLILSALSLGREARLRIMRRSLILVCSSPTGTTRAVIQASRAA